MTTWTWTEFGVVLGVVLVFFVVLEAVTWWWVGGAPEDH